jgi:hypothetical protein
MAAEQTAIRIPVAYADIRHPKLSEITSLPRPRYKGHWAVLTNDGPQSESFYNTLTTAELVCRPQPTSAAVSWDEEHHRVFIADRRFMPGIAGVENAPQAGERVGEAGGAIRYASPGALAIVYKRMSAAGFEPYRILERPQSVALFYKDPQGLIVEAVARKDAGAAEQELTPDAFLKAYAAA